MKPNNQITAGELCDECFVSEIEQKIDQLNRQYHAIILMCNTLSTLASSMRLMPNSLSGSQIDLFGKDSHALMNALGDCLNERDAVDDEMCKITSTIFRNARELFPIGSEDGVIEDNVEHRM